MKCRDIQDLLVGLADGTLDAGEKARVDEHLAGCEDCRMDVELLKETFAALRTGSEELPPTHYFSTLLPKVRARLEKKERAPGFMMPAWLGNAAAPLTVFAMGIVLVGLFRAFQPAEEYSPLRSIVAQIPADDISTVVTASSDPISSDIVGPSNDKLLETAPNANMIADNMKTELLAGDYTLQQVDPGVQADDKMIDELDDDAVSQVIERMNEQSTL